MARNSPTPASPLSRLSVATLKQRLKRQLEIDALVRDQLVTFTRILASYGCVDTDPSTPACGECAPCEAAAFLDKIGER
jgi:hypothetical protein